MNIIYVVILMAYLKEKFSIIKKCVVCDGNMEKSNLGNICNACKDKMKR